MEVLGRKEDKDEFIVRMTGQEYVGLQRLQARNADADLGLYYCDERMCRVHDESTPKSLREQCYLYHAMEHYKREFQYLATMHKVVLKEKPLGTGAVFVSP
jgi:hypothetical protein